MTNLALKTRSDTITGFGMAQSSGASSEVNPVRIPGVTVHAFFETTRTAALLEIVSRDRILSRAKIMIQPGGVSAAIAQYQATSTPNLLILEARAEHGAVLLDLDALAAVCDADTKVVVIGDSNDITLYRELLKRGVSDYLRSPDDAVSVVAAIAGVFSSPQTQKLGRVYAFIGAKGGVGSSTIAHNAAWMLGRHSGGGVILADMDLPFGTGSLDFDVEPVGGVADAICGDGRLDEQLFDRLLTRCDENLTLLAAPSLLDKTYDFDEDAFDAMLDIALASVSNLVLDMPHIWTGWTRKTLLAADEVVITAAPDLANLKNAKNLVHALRQARPNDPLPKLVLNLVGMPKRPEIKPQVFAEALQLEATIVLPFNAQAFGAASNNGRMVAEVAGRGSLAVSFRQLAESLIGRPPSVSRGLLGLNWSLRRKKTTRARA